MKSPKGTKGIREARRLARSGRPIAAASHLFRANRPALGLGEAREIVAGWGFPGKPGCNIKNALRGITVAG